MIPIRAKYNTEVSEDTNSHQYGIHMSFSDTIHYMCLYPDVRILMDIIEAHRGWSTDVKLTAAKAPLHTEID